MTPQPIRARSVVVLSVLVVFAATFAALAQTATAQGNPVSGVWYGSNLADGSHPTTVVFGQGRAASMPFVIVDFIEVGCTGGQPEILIGTAVLRADRIEFVNSIRHCADGSSFPVGRFSFDYDPAGQMHDATPDLDEVEYQKVCPRAFSGNFADSIASDIVGSEAGERLRGTAGDDVIDGLDGDDLIISGGGNDIVCGGGGADTVRAGSGIDIIWGDAGVDIIAGQGGNDIVFAGAGRDEVKGGSGHDVVYGEGAGDRLSGAAGNDLLDGGAGKDRISGQTGNDRLTGGAGRDVLDGGGGRDVATGGGGSDRCTAEVRVSCER